jgi:Fe-S-cluster containining protein
MKRNVRLEDITDGKIYELNDMVRADTGGCKDCYVCCTGMGDSVVLDPYDIYRMMQGLACSFDELLLTKINMHVEDLLILPNMKIEGEDERCVCLGEDGRCTVHAYRPSVCRLFPLGRYYHDDRFSYILQVHECVKPNRAKIKVKKWIGNPDGDRYDEFVLAWRNFKKNVQAYMKEVDSEEKVKEMNMYVLEKFFRRPYDSNRDFYEQFYERLQ